MNDKDGALLATAHEPAYGCGCTCERSFFVEDPSGAQVYRLAADDCSARSGGCSNFCAPSCCNETFDVDVFTPGGEYINTSTFVWPGCNCGGLTERSNLIAAFPEGASTDERAALIAGLMLVEYTVMEKKRQQDGGGGGGGGGG